MDEKINNNGIINKSNSKKTVKKKIVAKKQVDKKIDIQKFKDLDGKFLLVKVGNHLSPATDDDIKDIQEKLTTLLKENNIECLIFVTHHAVEMEIIGKLV